MIARMSWGRGDGRRGIVQSLRVTALATFGLNARRSVTHCLSLHAAAAAALGPMVPARGTSIKAHTHTHTHTEFKLGATIMPSNDHAVWGVRYLLYNGISVQVQYRRPRAGVSHSHCHSPVETSVVIFELELFVVHTSRRRRRRALPCHQSLPTRL